MPFTKCLINIKLNTCVIMPSFKLLILAATSKKIDIEIRSRVQFVFAIPYNKTAVFSVSQHWYLNPKVNPSTTPSNVSRLPPSQSVSLRHIVMSPRLFLVLRTGHSQKMHFLFPSLYPHLQPICASLNSPA
jgi:hypothetical protein